MGLFRLLAMDLTILGWVRLVSVSARVMVFWSRLLSFFNLRSTLSIRTLLALCLVTRT